MSTRTRCCMTLLDLKHTDTVTKADPEKNRSLLRPKRTGDGRYLDPIPSPKPLPHRTAPQPFNRILIYKVSSISIGIYLT